MKYALVTGGSRGIGRAVSVRLAKEGYHVIVNYVSNREQAQVTLDMIESAGGSGEMLRFDVGDRMQTASAIEGWMQEHPDGYIEVLVNNAGIRRDNLLLWMEDNDWDSVIGTGLDGFFNVTRLLVKPMLVKSMAE